jgi:23S rRNA (uracil1939-C5)-methyltransferase
MAFSKQNRFADVNITKFSNKGNGIGLLEQAPSGFSEAEISFSIPGDRVHSALLGKKRGKWKGHIQEIIHPSPDRIQPICLHFGSCGGCRWQQMSYEKQLKYKESIVREVFASLIDLDTEFRPISGSLPEWRYRNKMEFTFSSDLNKHKYLGLIMDSSKGKVLNLTECHLVNTWFIDALKAVRSWWEGSNLDAYHMLRNAGSLRTLILREGMNTGDRMVMLTVSGNPDFALKKQDLESFVAAIRNVIEVPTFKGKLCIFLRIQQIGKGMATNFYEMLLYGQDHIVEQMKIQISPNAEPLMFNFKISPTSFFQPNTSQAEKFYSMALQMANVNENSVVYDLFCGTGTLGICASKMAKNVVGIEISPEAALDARQNCLLNNCQNVTILSGAVRHVLNQIQSDGKISSPDIVLVDPPRPGLDPESMRQLIRLNPPAILSISCNPQTQAVNVAELIQHGYRVKVIQPLDQFPQTIHIENLILLVKK